MRNSLLVLAAALAAASSTGCAQQAESGMPDLKSIPKIDIHAHYTHSRDYLVPVLDEWNMRAVVVEVARGPDRTRWERMVEHQRQAPDHLVLATSFDASGFEDPDFAARTIATLDRDLARGARMVKVWKNVGMEFRDRAGNYVQIDDPRFQPIWDHLAERRIPVLAHIGEPRAAWLPLDPQNPHYDYYANHPQYHAHLHPEIPRWEAIIAARDRWLERNPRLTVVGAHLGSMAYDVDEVAQRLDRFPNFHVETAERFGDLVIQPTDKVRQFFTRYQDRILFGTDLGTGVPAAGLSAAELEAERRDYIEKRLQVTWDYLTGADSVDFVRTGTPFRFRTRGLALPREVVEKVYHGNAAALLGLSPGSSGEEAP